VGQVVALSLAATVSFLWLKLRPDSPVGGAGGAIFPVLVVITILYFSAAWLGPLLDEQVFAKARARRLRAERLGRPFLRDMMRARDKAKDRLSVVAIEVLDKAIDRLDAALLGPDEDELVAALGHAETVLQEQLGRRRKGILRDFLESIGGALLIALALRLFVVEAFKIPSGSMIPTLEIGDHIFVNKFVYGLSIPFTDPPRKFLRFSNPAPGDVVVFIAPEPADNAGEDFIKRVVATEGQVLQLKDGVLFVDGKPYERSGGHDTEYRESHEYGPAWRARTARQYMEQTGSALHSVLYERHGIHDWPAGATLGLNGLQCNGEVCVVEHGYVFCMGDNRDNSADSRKWGAVPLENVKGRAMFVWLSVDGSQPKMLGLMQHIRWSRMGLSIQ
jgi:signal peptidase I